MTDDFDRPLDERDDASAPPDPRPRGRSRRQRTARPTASNTDPADGSSVPMPPRPLGRRTDRPNAAAVPLAPTTELIGLSGADARSPDPATCPFFRSIDAAGSLLQPIEMPDGLNRCVAIDEPVPQSARQQELVCLTEAHVSCPRYLRGAVAGYQAVRAPVRNRAPSSAVLASVIVLVLSATASVGFLVMRGGLALALPSPSAVASQAAVAATPEPTRAATPSPSAAPTPSPVPSPTPTRPATVAPVTPPPTPAATPRSDRYDVLVPCPDAQDCWIYTVRAGDNFQSIVNWFGVPYDTVVAMNPGLGDPSTIHVGDVIRIPPPTR